MKVAAWLANFAVSSVIFIVGLYFTISLCVAYFKLSGQISEGQQMYFDLQTPTWTGLLIFQAASATIIGVALVLRRKLRDLVSKLDTKHQPSSLDLDNKSRALVSGGMLVGVGFLISAALIVVGQIDFSGPCTGYRRWICEFLQYLQAIGGVYAAASIYLLLGFGVLYQVNAALKRGKKIRL